MRPAARAFHLRQSPEPAALAARLFLFEEALSREEAERVLGDLLTPLLEGGLLALSAGEGAPPAGDSKSGDGQSGDSKSGDSKSGDLRTGDGQSGGSKSGDGQSGGSKSGERVSCRLVLGLVDDLYLFSDARSYGDDAVLPPGDGTIALLAAAFPDKTVDRALDLGCGSGTCALVLAKRAKQVVATDIYGRALALTRMNATMNGIGNVETREGSLFDPVANETFDLVVSQPPFIPKPEGAATSTFLYGGSRGDEIPLALLGGLAPHLAEHGRAVLLVEWPVAKDAVADRIRRALGTNEPDLLVLEAPRVGADEHATEYAASMHSRLDEDFVKDALMRRAHFDRESIAAIVPAFTVIQRSPHAGRQGFSDTIPITSRARGKVSSSRLDKLFAAREVGADPRRLLGAKLRVPAGTTFSEEQKGPGADKPSSVSARFSDEALIHPVPLTPELLAVVTLIHESDTVQAGLARYAEAFEVTGEEAFAFLPRIAQSLRQGLLEVAG